MICEHTPWRALEEDALVFAEQAALAQLLCIIHLYILISFLPPCMVAGGGGGAAAAPSPTFPIFGARDHF
jgi:hypothetical protein